MSVIGIDLGNGSCYIAVNRNGGIETIDNDYSLRATPSVVAFGERQRLVGIAAKNQQLTNLGNTVYGFKRYLGRKCDDPLVTEDTVAFNKVALGNDGSVGVKVVYLGEERKFSPVELTAMLLTKLKVTAEEAIQGNVQGCVISVPSYFTDVERRSLLDATKVANLNVLRLLNDTAAAALCYGFYKEDLPGLEERPRHVVIVDCGHSSTQVAITAFNNGALKVLSTAFDPCLGGRNFDWALADHFIREVYEKYIVDIAYDERLRMRLLTEAEKLKKQMSANATKLPLNIESLFGEQDFSSSISRAEFESMCQGLFRRFENVLQQALEDSKLDLAQIHSVEVVGGSSRIPGIKKLIEKVFQVSPSTTLNQDEAVSRGCAVMCAILSPAMKVRAFTITDLQPFPIKLVWDDFTGDDGSVEMFPRYHPVPFSKMILMEGKKNKSFSVKGEYGGNVPYPTNYMGLYSMRFPNDCPVPLKVRIGAKVDLNGIFSVHRASVQAETGRNENLMDLDVTSINGSLSSKQIDDKRLAEVQMISLDEQEKQRLASKNRLEEYIYELRQELESDLSPFIEENEKLLLSTTLLSLEDWLYGEGINESKDCFITKLEELRVQIEPFKQLRVQDQAKF